MNWARQVRTGIVLGALVGCGGGPPPPPPAPRTLTPASVDSTWAEAVQLFRAGKWTEAQAAFELVSGQLPTTDHRLVEARFFVAEIMLAKGQNLESVRMFRRVSDESSADSLAPAALLRAGDAYNGLWRRPELDPTYGQTARTVYREVLDRYPGTPTARQANLRIAGLNEKFANKEWRNALFYHRFKAYDSAILTLRNLVAEYPRSAITPTALVRLVETYDKLGYVEDRQETCIYIRRFHPTATGLEQACPVQAADSTGTG